MSWYSGKWSLVSHDSNFRAFFLVPFSPLSWSMEQAYLDLKESWVSCWTEKNTTFFLAWENRRHFATPPTVSPRKTSEKRAQRFHTDDASLPKSGQCFWLVEANFTSGTTNQKHYPNLGSDASSVRNFHVVVTLRIAICFLRLHPSRTLCKRPLSGVSKSKCLPVFRSLPRRRSASGTGTLEEPLRTTSAWEAMPSVQR